MRFEDLEMQLVIGEVSLTSQVYVASCCSGLHETLSSAQHPAKSRQQGCPCMQTRCSMSVWHLNGWTHCLLVRIQQLLLLLITLFCRGATAKSTRPRWVGGVLVGASKHAAWLCCVQGLGLRLADMLPSKVFHSESLPTLF